MKNILITGGAGFIGSHVCRKFTLKYPKYNIYNLDNLSYAGNLDNLRDIEKKKNYCFIEENIRNISALNDLFLKYKFDSVIHLAAESHVDRSIQDPFLFAETNILGTINLINVANKCWDGNFNGKIFYHISTDEVYGSLKNKGLFSELSPYDPKSPYSASKASADHFVRAYGNTYKIPYIISNCSNNYGPNQHPEKLIPLCITNILNENSLPVYGNGENIRDWLYVEDHADAIDLIFHSGKIFETYNIGGLNEWKNIDLVKEICSQMDQKLGNKNNTSQKLIKFVKDRPGHDLRYAIDSNKLRTSLGWSPKYKFKDGISKTIDWYLKNNLWLKKYNK